MTSSSERPDDTRATPFDGVRRRGAWWGAGAVLVASVAAGGLVGLAGFGAPAETGEATAEIDVPRPVVALPVEMNDRVEKWMRRFLTDQRSSFEMHLRREGLYAGMIRAELRERGMPEELLYLAMIESGFSPRATSSVSAVGLWQFMGPTAKEYGLRVDRWVDERRDPVKATAAALDYLRWLHDRYDSWYLAAAAYNAGPGRVDGVLRRHADGRVGDEAIYWEIIEHLPRETREYVPKLLAAATLAREAERHGFDVLRDGPYRFDRVWVPGGTQLSVVAASLEVEPRLLKRLNPHLVRDRTPPGGSFALRVPVGSSTQLIASMGTARSERLVDDD